MLERRTRGLYSSRSGRGAAMPDREQRRERQTGSGNAKPDVVTPNPK